MPSNWSAISLSSSKWRGFRRRRSFASGRWSTTCRCTRRRSTTSWRSGPSKPTSWSTGSRNRSRRSTTRTRPSTSGSRTGSSTSPTTASTATSRPATATRWRSTGAGRKGKTATIKQQVDEKIGDVSSIGTIFVVKATDADCEMREGRDVWFHEALKAADDECEAEPLDAEHPLYVLYTSGSTAKPKGVLHTTGGYLVGVTFTHRYVFDLKPDSDVFWCAADVGWVTGHSYIVYGPLSNGVTGVMYEGAPDYPDKDIWWEIVERYGVTIMYTAPTAIRACMTWGAEYPGRHDLSSLRLLGTVGEPINPKAWLWYHKVIGAERCPIVDTWWQTETGNILISPLPGITTTKPGSATKPLPGIDALVVDDEGNEVAGDTQ